ncbi:MAG: Amidase enhancer precursor [bacterium ADurb.Bin400]|nr:MAG: Amidase enhancer precursor [bacterium ADurb.Bin400]
MTKLFTKVSPTSGIALLMIPAVLVSIAAGIIIPTRTLASGHYDFSIPELQGRDPYETSVLASRMNFPDPYQPNSIVLARDDRAHDALLASRLANSPLNSSMLFVGRDHVPNIVMDEMARLHPRGFGPDGGVQVYIIGDISSNIETEIQHLRLLSKRIDGADPIVLSHNIDRYLRSVDSSFAANVLLVPVDQPAFGLPAVPWRGHSMLFTERDTIPDTTLQSLQQRNGLSPSLFLLGSNDYISDSLANEFANYGRINRIDGRDPFDLSLNAARYGRDFRPIDQRFFDDPRNYLHDHWNDNRRDFIAGQADNWQTITPALILSRDRIRGPVILITPDALDGRNGYPGFPYDDYNKWFDHFRDPNQRDVNATIYDRAIERGGDPNFSRPIVPQPNDGFRWDYFPWFR